MSAIIKAETVLEGLKCCLNGHDCLSCPYSKSSGQNCQKRLYKDATVIILSRSLKGSDAYDALMYAFREK